MAANLAEMRDSKVEPAGTLAGKRIVMVLSDLELGGAERQAILLARYLKGETGAAVTVVGLANRGGRAAQICEQHGIACACLPPRYPGNLYRTSRWFGWLLTCFTKTVRRLRPDVLLPYCTFANVTCGLTWRLTGARMCIWNQRDAGITRMNPLLERCAAWLTPCFVTNSTAGAICLQEAYRIAPERIHHISNGLELSPPEANRATWRKRLRLAENQFAACMLANLHKNKDHATLIRAWRLVVDQFPTDQPSPVLLLAGRWSNQADSLRDLANELGVFDEVRFLGAVDDVSGLLRAVDLKVLSSVREGCPNAVLEAMAVGLPVVATDNPGTRDVLGEDAQEFLVPPRDENALAAIVLAIARDPARRQDSGRKNHYRVESVFTAEEMVRGYLRLFREYIGQGGR